MSHQGHGGPTEGASSSERPELLEAKKILGDELATLLDAHGQIPSRWDEEKTPKALSDLKQRLETVTTLFHIEPGTALERIRMMKAKGGWPPYISYQTILNRIPLAEESNAPGLDAGCAYFLGLIPDDKAALVCKLHAAYSKDAVEQIRREMDSFDAESQTAWWLAASSLCQEGGVDQKGFLAQVEAFRQLRNDSQKMEQAAKGEFEQMTTTFSDPREFGFPFGVVNGSTQGAYVAGYPYGVEWSEKYGIFFVGTFEASLGLERYSWETFHPERDSNNPFEKSGPVFGSQQFMKCANLDQLFDVLRIVKKNLDATSSKPIPPHLKEDEFRAHMKPYVEDFHDHQETEERPQRCDILHKEVDRLFPGDAGNLPALRNNIYESFDVPQAGEHHNEGMFMDSHLHLILGHLKETQQAKFPEEVPPEIRPVLTKTSLEHGETLERYTFLHDIAKKDCLRITSADGSQRDVTWDEWKISLPQDVQSNPEGLRKHLRENTITGISYYHSGEGGQHGITGKKQVEALGYTGVAPAVLTAIEKHEVAYQFRSVKAATYKKHLGGLSPEERDLALTASYLDTRSSLGENQKPDLSNFVALVHSKHNFEVILEVETRLKSGANLDKKKLEKAIAKLFDADTRFQENAEAIAKRLERECRPTEYDDAILSIKLEALVLQGDITDAERAGILTLVIQGEPEEIGKLIGKKMSKIKSALGASEKKD